MEKLNRYCETTSYARVFTVLSLAPMPCLAVIVLTDSIPLHDPASGLQGSGLFWLRSAIVSFFVSYTVLEQCRHFVPSLHMTSALVVLMTLVATAATTLTEIGMASLIGYPVPFTIVASVPARLTVLGVWFYLKWGSLFREQPAVWQELITYLLGLMAQTSLTMIYPIYNFVFISLSSSGQTAFALVLPVLKLGAKNWMSHAFRHLEDLKPEIVIFNVELFHALFVACCMQSSTSTNTTILLIVIDLLQFWLAMVDI